MKTANNPSLHNSLMSSGKPRRQCRVVARTYPTHFASGNSLCFSAAFRFAVWNRPLTPALSRKLFSPHNPHPVFDHPLPLSAGEGNRSRPRGSCREPLRRARGVGACARPPAVVGGGGLRVYSSSIGKCRRCVGSRKSCINHCLLVRTKYPFLCCATGIRAQSSV